MGKDDIDSIEKCLNVRQTVSLVDEAYIASGKLPFVFWGVSRCVSLHKNAISFVEGLWISFGLCWQRRAYLCKGRYHQNNRKECLLKPLPKYNLQQTPRSEFPRKLPRKKMMGDPTFRDKDANGRRWYFKALCWDPESPMHDLCLGRSLWSLCAREVLKSNHLFYI